MSGTPEIETERLILRRFTLADAEAFFRLMSDEKVNTFLPLFSLKSIREAEEFLQENYFKSYEGPTGFRYAVCLKSDNIPIGYVSVNDDDNRDLAYGLRPDHWRRGIATEACGALIGRLRETDIPYITATHDVNNPGSGGVMKKIGMTYRYSYRELWQPKDIWVTFRMYQLNFDGRDDRVYRGYWDRYPVHFVEENV